MSKLKILTIVGARPQFIKAAMVSKALSKFQPAANQRTFEESIVHTGQHYDAAMSDVFFEEMDIPRPVVNLHVGSGGHGATTGAMMEGIERELLVRKPDWVLVYGDTNSTLAGALAAAKLRIPIAHIEAGLRSYNRRMPEEINRVLVDRLATLLFCPSENARTNLHREGITNGVHVVGDVMYDAVLHYRVRAIAPTIREPYILCTLHRAETTDDPARLRGLIDVLDEAPHKVIMPLHPRTRKLAERENIVPGKNVCWLEPVSYFAMLGYIEHSAYVITDSGGVQKEAYYLGKRCITARVETEWIELVDCGANRVVGHSPAALKEAFTWATSPMIENRDVYGAGDASERITGVLAKT